MSSASSAYALARRRREIMSRIEAHRIAVGSAWDYFEAAATRGEARAQRAVTWTRRVAGVAILIAGWRALRRPAPAELRRRRGAMGLVARTMGTVATLQKLSRWLRLATGWTA